MLAGRSRANVSENRPVESVVVATGAGDLVLQISAVTTRGSSAVTVPEITVFTDEPESRFNWSILNVEGDLGVTDT